MVLDKSMVTPPGQTRLTIRERDRMTLKLSVYHEHYGDKIDGKQMGGSFFLDQLEQPVDRKLANVTTRQPLYRGHLTSENSGILIIENTTTTSPGVIPSDEEREEVAGCVVRLWIGESTTPILIPPGLFVFLPGVDPSAVSIDCASEVRSASVRIMLYPR